MCLLAHQVRQDLEEGSTANGLLQVLSDKGEDLVFELCDINKPKEQETV